VHVTTSHETDQPGIGDPRVTVTVPAVPYSGSTSTADDFRAAARNLRRRYSPGGHNLRETVALLLERTATALDGTPSQHHPDDERLSAPDGRHVFRDLTFSERLDLPPSYHQPTWLYGDGVGRWVCRVCCDDDHARAWPCYRARRHGAEVAEFGGMDAYQ
jgi:hypothetical protein